MFTFDSVVRYSEVDSDGKLTLPEVINYFQDCSELHSRSLGVSVTANVDVGWVLNSWQIEINRYPSINEHIKVGTAPHKIKGIQGDRNFLMYDENGEVIIYANSIWSYFDFINNKPARVPESQMEAYKLEPAYDMEYAPRRIAIKDIDDDAFKSVADVSVTKSMIDLHGHMNNGNYVLVAMDYLPDDYIFNKVRVEYLLPTVCGEVLEVKQYKDDERLVTLLSGSDGLHAIVEFS